MKFQGSVIKEQDVTFAIIIVESHVLQSQTQIAQMQQFGRTAFGSVPIILMTQNSRGIPSYYGRQDIVRFLSQVSITRIPWKEYNIA